MFYREVLSDKLRPISQFQTAKEHQNLINSMAKEKELRLRIKELLRFVHDSELEGWINIFFIIDIDGMESNMLKNAQNSKLPELVETKRRKIKNEG